MVYNQVEPGQTIQNGLTGEEILVSELINGVSDVNLRQELNRKSSDTDYKGLVKIAETWHTAEITQAGLTLDEAEEAARRSAPLYSQRKSEVWLKSRAKQAEIKEQNRSREI